MQCGLGDEFATFAVQHLGLRSKLFLRDIHDYMNYSGEKPVKQGLINRLRNIYLPENDKRVFIRDTMAQITTACIEVILRKQGANISLDS